MILIDTSILVACNNKKDTHRSRATEIVKNAVSGMYGEVYITDYIFDECCTVLFARLGNLIETVKECMEIKEVERIIIEYELFEEAWNVFQNQKQTRFSFTDCSTLAVMQTYGITHLATFDTDFQKIKGISVIC